MSSMNRLEPRRLLSGDPTVTLSSKATLTVTGTDAVDVISITSGKTGYFVDIVSDGVSRPVGAPFGAKAVRRITILGLGDDDRISVGVGVDEPTTVDAGGGNDRVDILNLGELTLDGGSGVDRLRHISSAATAVPNASTMGLLRGGPGNDVLSTNVIGDTLDGGSGDGDRLVTLAGNFVVSTKYSPTTGGDFFGSSGTQNPETNPRVIFTINNETFSTEPI